MRPDTLEAHHFEALGTSCSLFGVGLSRDRLLEGESWVRSVGARLTRFAPDSELSRLNASTGRWLEVSPEMESLLRASLRAFKTSGGLVNIAVLPSMLAIGYTHSMTFPLPAGERERGAGDSSPLPEGERVRERGVTWQSATECARPTPRVADVLTVRSGRARLEPGCGIDLGGVAKGWMADRLREAMGANALANLGGDLSAGGSGPSGDGWPVGLGGVVVMLRDHGAATSSVRRRRWGNVHHLIDPRTGLPATTGLEEVSVVAATGFDAEVVAKTALLVGPVLAPTYCAAHALAWWLSPAPRREEGQGQPQFPPPRGGEGQGEGPETEVTDTRRTPVGRATAYPAPTAAMRPSRTTIVALSIGGRSVPSISRAPV